MFTVVREMSFSYGHRLLNYEGKCRHLHGHNGRLEIHLRADSLDARGMVMDFSEIKKKVAEWIDRELDHKMLLCREDPVLPYLRQIGEPVVVMDSNPTAENIARFIFEYAEKQGLPVQMVKLWETANSSATYSRQA
jgi:6-pyruvoyltetrahydropterin/6-carboxytetrahydropterin synthase